MGNLELKGRIYEADEEIKTVSEAIGECVEKIRSTASCVKWPGDGFDIYNLGMYLSDLKEAVCRGQDLHTRLKTCLRDKADLLKRLAE